MKKVLISGLIVGVMLFIISYGGLYIAITAFPEAFIEYNSPLFVGDGSKDIFFYLHAFVVGMALSVVWQLFKGLFRNHHFAMKGIGFGLLYAFVALLPVLWITFSALDVTLVTVGTWFLYGLGQAMIAGIIFAKLNP